MSRISKWIKEQDKLQFPLEHELQRIRVQYGIMKSRQRKAAQMALREEFEKRIK